MDYTNNQIKRILIIQDFVETAKVLSNVYADFENKEFIIDTFTDRDRIYRVYCSSIYNLIRAIQESKDYFFSSSKYAEFEARINQEYIADDNKYYSKENYKSTLFKIVQAIRDKANHSLADKCNDDTILFEAYIDFKVLEELRILITDMFYEVYNQLDKTKIKKIILNKPKIKYSLGKLSNKLNEFKLKIPESENKLPSPLKENNARAIELFEQQFSGNKLYDLFTKEPEALKEFDAADKEIQELFQKTETYINENGTDLEKEALKLFKEFVSGSESTNIKETDKRRKELQDKLEKLFKDNQS